MRSAEQLSQHKVRNPDQTKRLFCFSLTVRTIERLGSMQTQHLFLGAVFLIKVLSILLSFFLFDIREGGGFYLFVKSGNFAFCINSPGFRFSLLFVSFFVFVFNIQRR